MLKQYFKFIGLLTFILILSSCEDDPSSIGQKLIPPSDYLDIEETNTVVQNSKLTFTAYQDTNYAFGTANRTILGKHHDITAYQMLRWQFSFTDSQQTAVSNDRVVVKSAKVIMNYDYKLGDDNAPFDFEAFAINNEWSWANFNRDSLSLLQYSNYNLASANKEFTDSTITFEIDKDTIKSWLHERIDQTNYHNYGIILKPTSNTNKIYGFKALNYITLEVVIDDPGILSNDTVKSQLIWDTHVVMGDAPQSNKGNVILQAGLPIRGKLFFDFLPLLPKSVSLNKAVLELSYDRSESFIGNVSADSLWVSPFKDSLNNEGYNVSPALLTLDSNKVSGDVTNIVRFLISEENNQGFRIQLKDEAEAATQYAIFGAKAPDELKPKLTLFYTKKMN